MSRQSASAVSEDFIKTIGVALGTRNDGKAIKEKKLTEQFFSGKLKSATTAQLFSMSQVVRPDLGKWMTQYTGGNVVTNFNSAYKVSLEARRGTLKEELKILKAKSDSLHFEDSKTREIILGLLFVRELEGGASNKYKVPDNDDLKILFDANKITGFTDEQLKEITNYLSANKGEPREKAYRALMTSFRSLILESKAPVEPADEKAVSTDGAAPALSSSQLVSPAASAQKKQLSLSQTLTGDFKVDGIDSEIVGAILGKPALVQDGYKLPDPTGKPPEIKVYGGMIRFENDVITTGKSLATEDGEVEFVKQMKALFSATEKLSSTSATMPSSVTVDFVVAEYDRGHFSILSVTTNPLSKKITSIVHKDTSLDVDAAVMPDSLQAKLHVAVKDAIEKGDILPKTAPHLEKDAITYSCAQQQQNTCGDRVILRMLQAHHPERLKNFFSQSKEDLTSEGIASVVDDLLKLENEKMLREFTCHVVKKIPELGNKVGFINEVSSAAPASTTKDAPGARNADDTPRAINPPPAAVAPADNSTTVTFAEHDAFFKMKADKQKLLLENAIQKLDEGGFATKINWVHDVRLSKDAKSVIDSANKKITITLKVEDRKGEQQPVSVNLTRQDGVDPKGVRIATWTCTADFKSQKLSADEQEKMRFDLIAMESLALRLAQEPALPLTEATRIGIVPIQDAGQKKDFSKTFGFSPCGLTEREARLIEAHLQAGYKEVHYGGMIFNTLNPPVTPNAVGSLTKVVYQSLPSVQGAPPGKLSEPSDGSPTHK